MRWLPLLLVIFAGTCCAADGIALHLEGGDIVIQGAKFIKVNRYGSSVPSLSYRVVNATPYPWTTLVLRFDLKVLCNGTEERRTETTTGTLGSADEPGERFGQNYEHLIIPLTGQVDGCTGEVLGAKLVVAENDKYRIDGVTGARVDFAKQAAAERAAQKKREAREAEQAAAKRAELRARCATIYQATIHKKVADLTVQESRQIQACERLDMYPPR
jgi:hypothetical protein